MNYSIKPWLESLNSQKRKLLIGLILIVSFIIRVIIAVNTDGYKNDLALFYYWANHVYMSGIGDFYNLDIFVDYPPGYIYVLYGLGFLINLIEIQSGSILYLFILKLPIIIMDVVFAIVLYSLAKSRLSYSAMILLLCLFLFNPWTIVNGVVWGQVDILFSFMLVICLLYLTKEDTIKGAFFYALAALIKPQAFIFMPVILVYLFYKRSIKHWIICMAVGFPSFLIMTLPFFSGKGGLTQLISLYSGTLSSYPYASLNTFNAYTLFGYNWVSIKERFLTIPIELVSYLVIAATVIVIFYFAIKVNRTNGTLFYLAALTIAMVYLFVVKMHERYIFPLLLCLLIAYIFEKNKHYLYIILGFSLTTTINLISVLNIQSKTYTIPYDALTICCSLINLLLFCYLLFVGYKNFKPEKANVSSLEQAQSNIDRTALSAFTDKQKIEKLMIFTVVLVYAIIAFYQLGNKQAPETVWKPTEKDEYVMLDFGDVKKIDRVVIFSGADHEGEYTLSSYNDDLWTKQLTVTNKHTYALANQIWPLSIETQYILIQAEKVKFSLHEIAFFSEENKETPLPVTINGTNSVDEAISSAIHLIDEPQKIVYSPTYYDGTYFDEIYHARTAYEYSVGESIYETTHPPLGKLLIMLGIQLFGISPFGWRFIGALTGVVLLLVIYKLAKLIFEKHSYALTAMLLFAADFMHFTQTRLSSIDSYTVLFTLLMFYCMTVYYKTSFYEHKLWKTLIPLSLSGLFFGLSLSVKWNGFYGGAGLAIILFIILAKRYREAKKRLELDDTSTSITNPKSILQLLNSVIKPKRFSFAIWATLISSCLFFVAIPAIIYYSIFQLSFKLSNFATGWTSFVEVQKHMFEYHSQLVATHPFSSPWYEWQLLVRPMWYYVNNELANPTLTSTIAAFGNPLIWWFSIFTILFTLIWAIYKRHTMMIVIFIGYLSQLLPWVFVERITFIYHFFNMVPFVILSILYFFQQLERKYKWTSALRWQFTLASCFLFVLFYPVISGQPIEKVFIDTYLRWFNSWYF